MKDCVIILKEVPNHPRSVVARLLSSFERPSIIRVGSKDTLKAYTSPPVYSDKYLVIFSDIKNLESNITSIKLDIMYPVMVCSNSSTVTQAKELCVSKGVPYTIYDNAFTRELATEMIIEMASKPVSDNFCKTLLARVGLSPTRIISAITVLDQVGYAHSNITKYVDKYTYIDTHDVLESLLGICSSMAQMKRAALFMKQNRPWYNKYTRVQLLNEIDSILLIYRGMLSGELTSYTARDFASANSISRYNLQYGMSLFQRVNINRLLDLRTFVERASLLEVSMYLSIP